MYEYVPGGLMIFTVRQDDATGRLRGEIVDELPTRPIDRAKSFELQKKVKAHSKGRVANL